MILPDVTLSPNALTNLARAAGYLKRDLSTSQDELAWVTETVNAVCDRFEQETGRNLACRTYRDAAALTFTTTSGDATLTTGATATVREFDEVIGTGIEDGTRVYDITNATTLEMTRAATAAGAVSLTFGSEPLVVDARSDYSVDGYWQVYAGEWPLHAVYAVRSVDAAGAETALDLTAMRIVKDTGLILLPAASPASGRRSIEIDCLAGYMPPKTGTRRGRDGWHDLERLCLRAVGILFEDWSLSRGRSGGTDFANARDFVNGFEWPEDIKAGLSRYARRW